MFVQREGKTEMSWDLALDGDSGDVIFSPTLDLLGATGDGLTKQRILLRCKIPRGSWVYDEDKTLGSRLYQISSTPSAQQIVQAPALVREALEPMEDIAIVGVEATFDENNQIAVVVDFTPILSEDEIDLVTVSDEDDTGIQTTFTV
jgi:phage gp46-like protein